MNQFGEVLQWLMEGRGLRSPADLSGLLEEAGRDVPAERVRAFMEGEEWVDGYFPRWVAESLDLSAWETGILAYAVAYGQVRRSP